MKIRNLAVLLAAAVLLGFWAYRIVDTGRQARRPARVGQTVFENLPVNDVAGIFITTPETNFAIKRDEQQWKVPARFNYPAKFDKVADTLVALRELKIGQVVPGGSERAAAFNLQPPGSNAVAAATRLELRDAADKLLGELLIGKHFNTQPRGGSQQQMMFGGGGYPSGHYVMLPDGMVAVVGRTLDNMIEPAKSWLADDFINVAAADIEEIKVTGPGRAPVKVLRDKVSKTLSLAGLKPEEGTADSAKLSQLAGALSYLSFDDVADPALKPAETGLDQPVVFTARANGGRVYTLRIGKPVSSNSTDRYVAARVEYVAPPEPEKKAESDTAATNAPAVLPEPAAEDGQKDKADPKEEARGLDAKISPWIYILRSYRMDNMLLERDKLITPPPKPEAKDEEPAAAPAGAEAAPAAKPAVKPAAKPAVKQTDKPAVKPAAKPAVKPADKPAVKPAANPAEKAATKPAEKTAIQPAAKPAEPAAPAAEKPAAP